MEISVHPTRDKGVRIDLSGAEVATAINAYLVAHGVHVEGARTITVNGALCGSGRIYVDPSGSVTAAGFAPRGGISPPPGIG